MGPTLAFNLFLAPADKNDEIITKRKRVAKGGNVGGRLVPEDLKGKFLRVTDLTTIRTSKYIDRKEQINILMIYKKKEYHFCYIKNINRMMKPSRENSIIF